MTDPQTQNCISAVESGDYYPFASRAPSAADLEDHRAPETRAPRSLLSWGNLNPLVPASEPSTEDMRVAFVGNGAASHSGSITDGQSGEPAHNRGNGKLADRSSPHAASQHSGQSSRYNVSINFINTVVGAGIVGLPYVFRISGFYMALVLMVSGCLLTDYSVRLLVRTGMTHNRCNYEDLCHLALGRAGRAAVSLTMLVFDFGAMLSYLIIRGDAGTNVMAHATGWHNGDALRRATIAALACCTVLPLCMFRDVSKLENASLFSEITVFLVIIIVAYEIFHRGLPEEQGELVFVESPHGVFTAFGIVAFAFVCHDSAFLLNNTLRDNKNPQRWASVTHVSLGCALLTCLLLAVPGYLTFRGSTCSNLLNNYDAGSIPIIIMRSVYVLTMASTYPISFFVVRHITNAAIFSGRDDFQTIQEMSLFRHLALTLPIFFASLGVVMVVNNLGVVMAVAGALGGGVLAFIFPPLCHIVLAEKSILFWRNKGQVCASIVELGPPLLLLLFGCAIVPMVVYQTLTSAEESCVQL